MIISIIVAISKNRIIGSGDKLPWHLPADMARFRQLTLGKPVIMGQKTFESIGKPLTGRKNIILTRDKNFQAKGCIIVHSIDEALQKAEQAEEIMIAGGASVYEQFLPLADCLYLTLIEHAFEGDVYFPEFNDDHWEEVERIENKPDKDNPYQYSFVTLQRKK